MMRRKIRKELTRLTIIAMRNFEELKNAMGGLKNASEEFNQTLNKALEPTP